MGKSVHLAGDCLTRNGRAVRLAVLVWLAVLTLTAALTACAQYAGIPSAVTLCAGVYLFVAAGLWLQKPLLRAAHRREKRCCLTPARTLGMLALPLVYCPPALGVYALLSYANTEWTQLVSVFFSSVPRMILGGAVVLALVLLTALVCSAAGQFCRVSSLCWMEQEEPVGLSRRLGAALKHIFTPFRLTLRFLPLLLTAWVLFLGGEAAWFVYSDFFTPGLDLSTLALLFVSFVTTQPAWQPALTAVLTLVWILGLGMFLWPRWQLTRLYHLCRLLKRDGLLL